MRFPPTLLVPPPADLLGSASPTNGIVVPSPVPCLPPPAMYRKIPSAGLPIWRRPKTRKKTKEMALRKLRVSKAPWFPRQRAAGSRLRRTGAARSRSTVSRVSWTVGCGHRARQARVNRLRVPRRRLSASRSWWSRGQATASLALPAANRLMVSIRQSLSKCL